MSFKPLEVEERSEIHSSDCFKEIERCFGRKLKLGDRKAGLSQLGNNFHRKLFCFNIFSSALQ